MCFAATVSPGLGLSFRARQPRHPGGCGVSVGVVALVGGILPEQSRSSAHGNLNRPVRLLHLDDLSDRDRASWRAVFKPVWKICPSAFSYPHTQATRSNVHLVCCLVPRELRN